MVPAPIWMSSRAPKGSAGKAEAWLKSLCQGMEEAGFPVPFVC